MVTVQKLGFKEGEATVYEGTAGKPLSYLEVAPQVKLAGQHAAGTLFILERRYDELRRFADGHKGKWKKADLKRECPWSTHYFDTSTAALASENMVTIQHYSPQLAALTPKTELYGGGLKLTGSLSGGNIHVYSRYVLKMLNRPLKEEEVVKGDYVHPLWFWFAEEKKELIGNITPLIFRALKDCYNLDKGMGTYFDLSGTFWSVVLGRLGGRTGAGSDGGPLAGGDVRLVAVHSREKEAGAARALTTSLEELARK